MSRVLEETLSSLDSCLDHEPRLEFFDEIQELDSIGIEVFHNSEDSESLSDHSLEEELCPPEVDFPSLDDFEEDFSEIQSLKIVEICGDDLFSRKIIAIFAERLPPNDTFDYSKFLRYLLRVLDQIVESDYILVYFHFGLNKSNKPSLKWIFSAFKAFDRKYKKNLKNLLLVHPSRVIRIVFQVLKPLIRSETLIISLIINFFFKFSAKFGPKMVYISRLSQLSEFLDLKQIQIPKQVIQ